MPFDRFAAIDENALFPTEVLAALAEYLGIAEMQERLGVLETPGLTMLWPKAGVLPAGYLECDGQAVSRALYPDLFAAIGTSEGAGDGSTTFNVPNLKGKTIFGHDPSDVAFDTIGETGGAKTHTVANNNLPAHTHTVPDHVHGMSHDHDGSTSAIRALNADSPLRTVASFGDPLDNVMGYVTTSVVNLTVDTNPFSGNTGGSNLGAPETGNGPTTNAAINHLNPYSVRRWVIKT